MRRKIILFGIDGGTWTLLDRYINDGYMPTMASLLNRGIKGTLLSTFPPLTLPAWTSIFTGVNPGKHGLVGFPGHMQVDGKPSSITFRGNETKSLWQILSEKGMRSIVINDPVSYVPEKINGIMITGLLTLSKSNYVYPSNLHGEIEKLVGNYMYELPMEFYRLVKTDKEKAYALLKEFDEKIATISLTFARNYEWDILAPIFTSTDRLQHFFWNDEEYMKRHYVHLDNILKNFLDLVTEEEANIVVVSDHGFGPYNRAFFVNTWLNKAGYQRIRRNVPLSFLSALGLSRARVIKILDKLHLLNAAQNIALNRFKGLEEMARFYDRQIDYERSLAYAISNYGIYVNDKVKGYESLTESLYQIQDNDSQVVRKIFKREEVMWGPYVERAPDLFVDTFEGYELLHYSSNTEFGEPADLKGLAVRTGCHRPEGIFLACGTDIRSNSQLKQPLRTWDITPTILQMLGLPVPSYMDGSVLEEIFIPGSKPANRLGKVDSQSEISNIRQRIKLLKSGKREHHEPSGQ